MINLLFEGGILFMSILTITLAASIGMSIKYFIQKSADSNQLGLIKSIGLFALVLGLLGQFIGLYSAMEMISSMKGGVSPALLAQGLKVSSITSIYGMIIFAVSYLMWFGLNYK